MKKLLGCVAAAVLALSPRSPPPRGRCPAGKENAHARLHVQGQAGREPPRKCSRGRCPSPTRPTPTRGSPASTATTRRRPGRPRSPARLPQGHQGRRPEARTTPSTAARTIACRRCSPASAATRARSPRTKPPTPRSAGTLRGLPQHPEEIARPVSDGSCRAGDEVSRPRQYRRDRYPAPNSFLPLQDNRTPESHRREENVGWGTRIRTLISRVRVCCPAVGRSPSDGGNIPSSRPQVKCRLPESRLCTERPRERVRPGRLRPPSSLRTARRTRASTVSRPMTAMLSNSGGLTLWPVTADAQDAEDLVRREAQLLDEGAQRRLGDLVRDARGGPRGSPGTARRPPPTRPR